MRERTRDWLRKCLTIALGVLVMSVAYNMFLVPAKIAPGGVSGAATIVYYLTGLPIGAVSLAMNVPLFILGWRQEGAISSCAPCFPRCCCPLRWTR